VIRYNKNKRISIGSEMSGGFRNVYIHDCTVTGEINRAIHIKTNRERGGIVENIWFKNIHSGAVKEYAIFLNMYYGPFKGEGPFDPVNIEAVTERTPVFRNISFKNITCKNSESPIVIFGLQEMPPQNITFEDIEMSAKRGVICNYGKEISFNNINITVADGPAVSILGSAGLTFNNFKTTNSVKPFLEVAGEEVRNIRFYGDYDIDLDTIVIHPSVNKDEIIFKTL
jgi:polygalacturonase